MRLTCLALDAKEASRRVIGRALLPARWKLQELAMRRATNEFDKAFGLDQRILLAANPSEQARYRQMVLAFRKKIH